MRAKVADLITGATISLLLLTVSACLEYMKVTVEGDPIKPTFVLEEKLLISSVSVEEYDPEKNVWRLVWNVGKSLDTVPVNIDRFIYGQAPSGYKQVTGPAALQLEHLYSVSIISGPTRAEGYFALRKNGDMTKIINIDMRGRNASDVVMRNEGWNLRI